MLKKTFLVFAVMCAAILIGCSTTETTNNSNTTSSNSSSGSSTTAPPTTTSTTPATTTASTGDKIGVPECDDFIAKYDACLSKVPEMARAQFKSSIDQWRASWKKLAENPETKSTLAAACKEAADKQTAALKQFGCTF
jgi:cytoskeletal protein RodZ